MTKTAVVILNYNGEHLLQKFLPSVIHHTPHADIYIADNASTDHSVSVIREKFPQVKVILLEKNYGFCGGYNRALKSVQAEYYVLLNSDVEVTPRWLEPLIELLDKNNVIGAVQPKVLSFHNKNKFEYAGAGGGLIDALGYPFCRGRIFNAIEEDQGQYNDLINIFWATGACLTIRAATFHTLGGFDEDFFAHMEEIDLCWKINRTGKEVYYCGMSTVYHVGAGTLGYESPRKTYLNFNNGLTLILKHLNPTELLYKLPLRMSLDWLAAFVFLLKLQPENTWAVLKAHINFFKSLDKNWKKRTEIQKNYPDYSTHQVYHGLIILEYYFKRKKKLIIPNRSALA